MFLSGNAVAENWTNAVNNSDFFQFKGYVTAILERLGFKSLNHKPVVNDVFSEGISIATNNDILVEFGSIKKSILKKFDIKQDVFYADFNWELVLKLLSNKIKFTSISKFPEVRRDFSLLVDTSVTFEQIYTIANQTEKVILKNVNLFDVYEGANLPEGKKSYAISFTLQEDSKTLTDVQIDKIMNKIQTNLETGIGAQLR